MTPPRTVLSLTVILILGFLSHRTHSVIDGSPVSPRKLEITHPGLIWLRKTVVHHKDQHLRDDLMRNIQKARALNPSGTGKPLEITPNLRIGSEDFTRFYLEDDDWDSIKSYLVGAALFWGLADLPTLGICPASEAPITTDLGILKGKLLYGIDHACSEGVQ